jgi:hypothetical protein
MSEDRLEEIKRFAYENAHDDSYVWWLIAEVDGLRGIVAAVAALPEDLRIYDTLHCIFCGAYYGRMTGPNPRRGYDTHEAGCVWAAAKAAVDRPTKP